MHNPGESEKLTALIFDMDGLLIESESLWRKAEISVLGTLGVPLTEAMCLETMGLRSDEVVRYWFDRFPWKGVSEQEVVERIDNEVKSLIGSEGKSMPGAMELIDVCRELKLKIALATSSSMFLVDAVLKRFNLIKAFDAVHSAEDEEFGKPHPAVYLSTARSLGVSPSKCIALEDSIRGMISALAAGMKCIAVPDPEFRDNPRFAAADAVLSSLQEISKAKLQDFLQGRLF